MSAEPTSMAEYKLQEFAADVAGFNSLIGELLEEPERFFGLPHFEPDHPIVYAGDEDEA